MEDVDWSRDAEVYDLMAEINPAYRELLADFRSFLASAELSERMVLGDFGAGTGNFSTLAARAVPGLRVVHIDSDMGMNELARSKGSGGRFEIEAADLDGMVPATGSIFHLRDASRGHAPRCWCPPSISDPIG